VHTRRVSRKWKRGDKVRLWSGSEFVDPMAETTSQTSLSVFEDGYDEWSARCEYCLELIVERTTRRTAGNRLRSHRNRCEQNPDRTQPKPKPPLKELARLDDLRIELSL